MRIEGWAERLDAMVAWHRARPFEWGRTDCATLFADCVTTLTGTDRAHALRGYTSQTGALRALRSNGFETCGEFVRSEFPAIAPAHANRGDLAFLDPGIVHPLMSPCVVLGAFMVTRSEYEWMVFPRALAHSAFEVN